MKISQRRIVISISIKMLTRCHLEIGLRVSLYRRILLGDCTVITINIICTTFTVVDLGKMFVCSWFCGIVRGPCRCGTPYSLLDGLLHRYHIWLVIRLILPQLGEEWLLPQRDSKSNISWSTMATFGSYGTA